MFIGVIPYINYFGVIELIGLILVLVALYGMAGHYKEGRIFNGALYGIIVAIVGVVVAVFTLFLVVLTSLTDFLHQIYPNWNGDWTTLSGMTPNTSNIDFSSIASFLGGLVGVLVILWIAAIVSAFLVRRSLGALSAKSGVGLFSTAGVLLLVGAVLIIAFGIGLILIWISALLTAIAFFQMKPQQAQPPTTAAAPQ